MKFLLSALLSVSFFALQTSSGWCGAISTFDNNTEGWSVVSFNDIVSNNFTVSGTYSATFSSTGGNPGGYITSTDPDGGDFTFAAPGSYLGNQVSSLGSLISYDVIHTGSVDLQGADVILEGGGTRLVWQSNPPLVPNDVWQHVSLTLAPSPQWHVGATNGAAATPADFTTALASLTGFYIRGEYTNGGESAGLDNVRLGSVPEPASVTLLGIGLVFLSYRRQTAVKTPKQALFL